MAPKRSSVAASAGQQVSEILAVAERNAEQLEGEARDRAAAALSEAATTLESLAAELRSRASGLGAEVMPEPQVPQPEVDPAPQIVPEPEPPTEPEPGPTPVPEPTPDPVPEPVPDPIPNEPAQPAAETNGSDAGARLVAMKMALDGKSREEIAAHLDQSFELGDSAGLLDDVFARAGK